MTKIYKSDLLTEKKCTGCNLIKPVSQFSRRSGWHAHTWRHYSTYCRDCEKARVKEYYRTRPGLNASRCKARYQKNKKEICEKRRGSGKWLEFTYGITLDQKKAMEVAQGNLCLICKKESKLSVDHDHETKIIRGLLCQPCNMALGLFKDSIDSLHSAIKYLEIQR